jgi:hypothetical protein
MARARATVTTDHDEIRRWAEERNAQPACVRQTGGGGDIGMIRLDFPGFSGEGTLEPITWEEWFQKFDESNLALLHQETLASGEKSNFNKLIARETAQARAKGQYRASRRKLKTGTALAASSRSRTKRQSSSARAKSASASKSRSRTSARTKGAAARRTAGQRARPLAAGRVKSRSKSSRTSQGKSRQRTSTRARRGTTAATSRSTGTRTANRSAGKVLKSAKRIKRGAENIIKIERGQGRRVSHTSKGSPRSVGRKKAA